MSQLINKFKCLRKLKKQFRRDIKLFYVLNCDFSSEINALIVTNDDMVYALRNEENVLCLFKTNKVQNKFIIKELCHKRVIDFGNNLRYLFARTFDGKVYYCKFRETKPQLIESLLNHNIIDICCGDKQVIALTDNGIVYTSNLFFDLDFDRSLIDSEELDFKELKSNAFNGEKVKAISCGPLHALALTESGCVLYFLDN
jgi:alpha-tubulin suppressor-like RCC1 family protein